MTFQLKHVENIYVYRVIVVIKIEEQHLSLPSVHLTIFESDMQLSINRKSVINGVLDVICCVLLDRQ